MRAVVRQDGGARLAGPGPDGHSIKRSNPADIAEVSLADYGCVQASSRTRASWISREPEDKPSSIGTFPVPRPAEAT
ncbi:hypothetical protein CKO27_00205 [Thiocystis violacea]|nr:hypothetical protein [Thiocystis violacea]